MADPVSYGVTYPGLQITKADMVHTHGVTPSVCYCTAIPVAPTNEPAITDGTLTFTANGSPLFSFKHCAIRAFYLQAPRPCNNLRAEVEIVDRRHLWQYQTVGGRYNIADGTGVIQEDFEKTLEELFIILLEALGETEGSYDLQLPDDTVAAPAVDWDNMRADLALADLAEQAGCLICLTNDNRIVIEPYGSGPEYDASEDLRTPIVNFPIDASESLVAVEFAPTRYQMWITCEPIAINTDSTLSALTEADWLDEYTVFRQYNAPGAHHNTGNTSSPYWGVKTDYLSQTVFRKQKDMLYRMYRIKELYRFEDNTLPYDKHFNTIDDILPLHETNLFRIRPSIDSPTTPVTADIQETWNDVPDYSPPFVLTDGVGDFSWPVDGAEQGSFSEEPGQPTIDFDRGIIYFDRFVFGINSDGYAEPAVVYINATFSVRDPDTGTYMRHRYTPKDSDLTSTTRYEDIFLYVDVPGNASDAINTNRTELDREIGPSLSSRYSHSDLMSSFVQWNGIKNYSIRGNVPQMHWHLSSERIYTERGYNFEHTLLAPVHAARLRRERS